MRRQLLEGIENRSARPAEIHQADDRSRAAASCGRLNSICLLQAGRAQSQADLCPDLASTRDRGNTETKGHLLPMTTRWRQGLRDQGKVYGTNLRLDVKAALLARLPRGLREGCATVRVSPRAIRAFIFWCGKHTREGIKPRGGRRRCATGRALTMTRVVGQVWLVARIARTSPSTGHAAYQT